MLPITRILFLTLTIGLTVVFVGSQAHAQTSRFYFSGYMGLNTFPKLDFKDKTTPSSGQIELNNSISFAGAMGLRLSQKVRIETELSYRSASVGNMGFSNAGRFPAGGKMKSWLPMINLYYDFDIKWPIQPYVTAGIGYGFHDLSIDDLSGLAIDSTGSDENFIWQIGGGLKYRVAPTIAFTGGYRYLDGTDLDFGDYEIDYGSHEFRIGLEYDLPFK